MQVPKLRFKEFTELWQEKKLEDVATRFEYGMNLPSKDYDSYNRYIRITDIDEETRNYISNLPVSPDGKLEDKYIVNKNDILFSRTGASVGKTYLYKEKDGKLYFAGFLIRVHINELYNSYFIFSQTLIDRYFKWVSLTSMRTGQPGINSQEYAQYKIYLPSLEEQTKISNFLSLIDKKIELQTQLVDNLNLYKKGLLKKVFSNNSAWKTAKLGNCLKTICNGTSNNQLSYKTDYPVTRIETISNGIIDYSKIGYINYFDNIDEFKLHKGDILFSNINSVKHIGKVAFFDNDKTLYHGMNLLRISTNEKLNSKFLYYLLNTYNMKKYFTINCKQAVNQASLSIEDICRCIIKIPSIEEQNRIAELFSSIDDKISYETNKLNNLKEYKKGLLQKMFI